LVLSDVKVGEGCSELLQLIFNQIDIISFEILQCKYNQSNKNIDIKFGVHDVFLK